MTTKKEIKRDIFDTLKESVADSFNVIPRSSDIKKKLFESDFPLAFEVPFVLEDDIQEILKTVNQQATVNPILRDSFTMSYKDNSNTLVVKSKTQEVNDALIGLINDFQIYGNPQQTGATPLGAQEVEEKTGLAADISEIMDNSPALCPVCNSMETVAMGESIYRCRACSHLFEAKQYEEDKLIDPDSIDPDEKADVVLRKKEEENLNEEGMAGGLATGGDGGTTTADMAEIPTQFTKVTKRKMKKAKNEI